MQGRFYARARRPLVRCVWSRFDASPSRLRQICQARSRCFVVPSPFLLRTFVSAVTMIGSTNHAHLPLGKVNVWSCKAARFLILSIFLSCDVVCETRLDAKCLLNSDEPMNAVLLVGMSLTGPWNALNFQKFRLLDAETLVAPQKKPSPCNVNVDVQVAPAPKHSSAAFCPTLCSIFALFQPKIRLFAKAMALSRAHTLFAWYTVLQSQRRSNPFNCASIMSDHATSGTQYLLYCSIRLLLILCFLPKFGPPMLQFITQIILETLEAVIKYYNSVQHNYDILSQYSSISLALRFDDSYVPRIFATLKPCARHNNSSNGWKIGRHGGSRVSPHFESLGPGGVQSLSTTFFFWGGNNKNEWPRRLWSKESPSLWETQKSPLVDPLTQQGMNLKTKGTWQLGINIQTTSKTYSINGTNDYLN